MAIDIAKCNIAIAHPGGNADGVVGGESRDLGASSEVPDDGGLVCVVADHIATGAAFADIVDRNENDGMHMALKVALKLERVVLQAEDG